MDIFRNYKRTEFLFKPDPKASEPFPPSYYENEKRVKEKLARIKDPREMKKAN